MKRTIGIILTVCAIIVLSFLICGCASFNRMTKSFNSDLNGGLNRTVTVYDYNGNVLGEWSGKFDISNNDNEIYFDDENGKRVIIQNGIVICEEN